MGQKHSHQEHQSGHSKQEKKPANDESEGGHTHEHKKHETKHEDHAEKHAHEDLPQLIGESMVLDEMDIRTLSQALPLDHKKKWKLLYNSARHGLAFNRFTAHCVDQGPTLVILRDKDGFVFGGFAAEDWKKSGKFFGKPECFVFQLKPRRIVYRSTSDNQNYMWLNWGTETLFNGVGMGGQMDFFGWCLDDFFESGHCRGNPSSTYRNSQLSKQAEFTLDYCEVWQLKEKIKYDEFGEPISVLNDEDNPDKKILEMTGHEFTVLNLGPNIHELEGESLSD